MVTRAAIARETARDWELSKQQWRRYFRSAKSYQGACVLQYLQTTWRMA